MKDLIKSFDETYGILRPALAGFRMTPKMEQVFALAPPIFLAGVVTFLAPCTLPLVPAYLGLISGVPHDAIYDPAKIKSWRWRIVTAGLFYVIGFSAVFILFGVGFGLLGTQFSQWRSGFERVAGVFVVLFGIFLLARWKLPGLAVPGKFQKKIAALGGRSRYLTALMLGASFGFGWTPCVGPILGAVLTLAAVSQEAGKAALLLGIYSLGLALPFMILAFGAGTAIRLVPRITPFLETLTTFSGVLFVALGILLFSGNLALLIRWWFDIARILHINYDFIYNYL